MRGRGRGRECGRGSIVSDDSSSQGDEEAGALPEAQDTAPDIKSHPIGIIINSHAPPKGIRFTIHKKQFDGFAGYDELPERLMGEIVAWVSKKDDHLASG